jgi:16S rRNA processing protein RimM
MSSRSSKTTEAPAETAGTSAPAFPDAPRRDLPSRVAVGRVLRPHGLKGEVVVEVLSDVPGRFDPGRRLFAVRGEAPDRSHGTPQDRTLVVAASQPHKSGARVRFQGIEDCDAAEALRDLNLEVERSTVPAAEPGTYYYYELLGCRCYDGDRDLGEVVDLVEDGGGLLLIVLMVADGEADGDQRVPVPFVESFLREVDVARGRIVLDLPPGLLETCASRS